MPKLPQVSSADLVKVFKKLGYEIVAQRGSHIKMKNQEGKTVIIPNHKQIKKGTLKKGILNPLNITVEQLIQLLKNKKVESKK
jgi:predicted RNA binding protein YcfA (HicA-like mRNA interferase family)